jgi:hypothetical protein
MEFYSADIEMLRSGWNTLYENRRTAQNVVMDDVAPKTTPESCITLFHIQLRIQNKDDTSLPYCSVCVGMALPNCIIPKAFCTIVFSILSNLCIFFFRLEKIQSRLAILSILSWDLSLLLIQFLRRTAFGLPVLRCP